MKKKRVMKIVIDRDIPYIRGILEPYARTVYIAGDRIASCDVADADALIVRTRTTCDEALLSGSSVKLIATATIGYDHIDLEYCREAGIEVVTSAGCNARGVLQWMGAALSYASKVQGWEPREKCIGVVGVGNVGSLVASYAKSWGFDVLCCDPPRQRAMTSGESCARGESLYTPDEFVPFARIISECDIITFHTPLTRKGKDATYHLADGAFFQQARHGTLVINCARGGIADTQSMLSALESGKCACCLDTWENEPDIDLRLLDAALVSTPHIAGYSAQGKANAASMAVKAAARKFGLPLTGWYPAGEVPRVTPSPINWDELTGSIERYCDIRKETAALKHAPEDFEDIRNNYPYRTEYF